MEILRLPDVKYLDGCEDDEANEMEENSVSVDDKRLISLRRKGFAKKSAQEKSLGAFWWWRVADWRNGVEVMCVVGKHENKCTIAEKTIEGEK